MKFNKNILLPIVLLPIWYGIYSQLQTITNWLTDDVLKLSAGAHFTESLRFFLFEFPKVLLLLVLIIQMQ